MKKVLSLVFLVLMSSGLLAYNTSNYKEIGGARWVIGGSADVASGGEIDVESGGSLKIAGTAISATAAELNILDGVTAVAGEINLLDLSLQTTTTTTAGAISVTKRVANIDSTGGTFAVTLAAPDATMVGQVLVITLTVDNGDVTLALTNVVGGTAATTATFDAAGETLILIGGAGGKWIVLKEYGVTLS